MLVKISIITVCKNAENAIERTMPSVVSQNCFNENIEYVIVDGASTDKTVEIIQQYANKYPIKWISEPDSGIYNAMNKGIKMATGDYLLFLNAGDYLIHYNVIKSLMNLFESYKFDMIYGDLFCIDPYSKHYLIYSVEDDILNACFFYQRYLPHPSTFYKRELFEKFGGFEENFKIIADNVLNKKLVCDHHVSVKHINQIISVFLSDGISSTNAKLSLQEKDFFREKYFSKKEIYEAEKQIQKSEMIKCRDKKKSPLRFLAKILSKLHECWVNR